MSKCRNASLQLSVLASMALVGCAPTRQIAIDYPSVAEANDAESSQSTKSKSFQALPGFQVIDGDDYYVRLISEFEFKGDNILKSGCNNIAPTYEKNDLSSTLIFSLRNDVIKFNNEAVGFVYQAGTGKCNFKFEAKKLNLTPWIRLDLAKETAVDYSFFSSTNSNVDVPGLVGGVANASSLLALTGVGMGVAVMGQFAGQWVKNNQQLTTTEQATPSTKKSSESHSLPATVNFSGKMGSLNQTAFKVYEVAEGGINLLMSDTKPLGELKIYPEITPSLLLKKTTDGLPDARDLSLDEISYLPIKSAAGEIKLLQLIEQSQHPAKPNLKPNWADYQDVVSNCRKLKLVMKDLGFNKFDRNTFLYYFLMQSKDWKSYNVNTQAAIQGESDAKKLADYRSKDFSTCLTGDDFFVMKTMGLPVNTQAEWEQVGDSIQKQEQLLRPLKSVERQLLAVLKNPSQTEMEKQLYPLLATEKNGDGTVLLQDNLGDFGLEKLLSSPVEPLPSTTGNQVSASTENSKPVPGQGVIVNAHQLAYVFTSLAIQELSCARPVPGQQGNGIGILLFTTKEGGVRARGAALEFEFVGGKVNRVSFQLPTHRDFEQDLIDRPDIGGCQINPGFLEKLH